MESVFGGWQYELIFARHRRVVTEPAFAHGTGPVFIRADRHGTGERVIMPLAADGEHGDGVLGATVYRVESRRRDEVVDWVAGAESVRFFPVPGAAVSPHGPRVGTDALAAPTVAADCPGGGPTS